MMSEMTCLMDVVLMKYLQNRIRYKVRYEVNFLKIASYSFSQLLHSTVISHPIVLEDVQEYRYTVSRLSIDLVLEFIG